MTKLPCVYIMSNAHRTIYTGVTSDLYKRVWEHKNHVHAGFTKKHNCIREAQLHQVGIHCRVQRMDDAIAWKKVVKGKSRAKKVAMIEERNPRWNDLAWNWYDG